jgi:hypothetical protein
MLALAKVKEAIRNKYAWPGGYPLFLVMEDGEAISIDAARECWREIVGAHLRPQYLDKQRQVAAVAINWEDSELYCAHSGAKIESAYGEDSDYVKGSE